MSWGPEQEERPFQRKASWRARAAFIGLVLVPAGVLGLLAAAALLGGAVRLFIWCAGV